MPVAIVLNPFSQPDLWLTSLRELLPDEDIYLWPDHPERDEVELVIAWRMKRDDLNSFENLRAILSMGAGAEQWQKPGTPDVAIVRLSDPAMSDEMAAYALHWVLHFQRGFDKPADAGDLPRWFEKTATVATDYPVGILGFGDIGSRVGRAFVDLGYPVNAWSRRGTDDSAVRSYRGDAELSSFLAASRAVVNVLPNTPATTGLMDATRFSQFAADSVFINIGRGAIVADEADLIHALDDGPLSAVVLDVTNPEPPDAGSPLLAHSRVRITRHIAGTTQAATAAPLIAANINRIRRGEAPFPLVDRASGY